MSKRKSHRRRQAPAGSRPGTLAVPADAPARHIHVMDWTQERFDEIDVHKVDDLARFKQPGTTSWIEVDGLGDEAGLRRIAEIFGIHPLALADIVNVPQRPKFDTFEGHDLVICRMARKSENGDCELEQVGVVIGPSWVISFQEGRKDVWDPVRARIRGGALIRSMAADYLAYALIDTLIDGYYPVVEQLGEELEELEDQVVSHPVRTTLGRIHAARRLLLTLARNMRQHRDAVNSLMRAEGPRLTAGVLIYYRDAYDHAIQINEQLETYRELAVSLMEVYLSSVSNRMNEVMKVLTVIGSIFLPLTFIVGVYGMNFEYLPELHVRWFYPFLWVVMIGIAVGMFIYFRRRGWIGNAEEDRDAAGKR